MPEQTRQHRRIQLLTRQTAPLSGLWQKRPMPSPVLSQTLQRSTPRAANSLPWSPHFRRTSRQSPQKLPQKQPPRFLPDKGVAENKENKKAVNSCGKSIFAKPLSNCQGSCLWVIPLWKTSPWQSCVIITIMIQTCSLYQWQSTHGALRAIKLELAQKA